MENNVLLNMLKNQYFISITMLERIIEICPNEIWNCKKSGYIFWQQLIHVFAGVKWWLSEEKTENAPYSEINERKIYPEFENDPETILVKEDVLKYFDEIKKVSEKWFCGKNDEWLGHVLHP